MVFEFACPRTCPKPEFGTHQSAFTSTAIGLDFLATHLQVFAARWNAVLAEGDAAANGCGLPQLHGPAILLFFLRVGSGLVCGWGLRQVRVSVTLIHKGESSCEDSEGGVASTVWCRLASRRDGRKYAHKIPEVKASDCHNPLKCFLQKWPRGHCSSTRQLLGTSKVRGGGGSGGQLRSLHLRQC